MEQYEGKEKKMSEDKELYTDSLTSIMLHEQKQIRDLEVQIVALQRKIKDKRYALCMRLVDHSGITFYDVNEFNVGKLLGVRLLETPMALVQWDNLHEGWINPENLITTEGADILQKRTEE